MSMRIYDITISDEDVAYVKDRVMEMTKPFTQGMLYQYWGQRQVSKTAKKPLTYTHSIDFHWVREEASNRLLQAMRKLGMIRWNKKLVKWERIT